MPMRASHAPARLYGRLYADSNLFSRLSVTENFPPVRCEFSFPCLYPIPHRPSRGVLPQGSQGGRVCRRKATISDSMACGGPYGR